ncbi:MAG: 1-phosphofructokinase family hexose kinase [Planctomycetota bacterium]|nr:1-phosphofructokinase family hexose kinase [Planctomycetota bacterium]
MTTTGLILCVGTTPALQRAMIFDGLAINGVNRAAEVIEAAAGKSVNVAKVLAALGQRVLATGFVGGQRGSILREFLDQGGIAHDFISVAAPTRLCVTLIDRASHTHTELVEESQAVAAADYSALLDKLRSLIPRCGMLVCSGTLPPNAPRDFYARCIGIASAGNVRTILDAVGLPLLEALSAGPTVIKPNRAELGRTLSLGTESDDDLLAAMRRATELGAQSIVVTLGSEGAIAFDGTDFYRIRIPRLDVINTIGSGDAFAAGLASALVQDQPLVEAARVGAACGCANALTYLAGQVHVEDVAGLLPRVQATLIAGA